MLFSWNVFKIVHMIFFKLKSYPENIVIMIFFLKQTSQPIDQFYIDKSCRIFLHISFWRIAKQLYISMLHWPANNIDGLEQDCSIAIVSAMEML